MSSGDRTCQGALGVDANMSDTASLGFLYNTASLASLEVGKGVRCLNKRQLHDDTLERHCIFCVSTFWCFYLLYYRVFYTTRRSILIT